MGRSEREWTAVAELYPTSAVAQYGLASVASRAGHATVAIRALREARRLGYHGLLQDDPDLNPLQSSPEWREVAGAYERAELEWRASHSDPTTIKIHTDDIERFWRTWDSVQAKPVAERAAAFARDYLEAGSDGLREYYLTKCRQPEVFAQALNRRAEFYQAIRPATLRLKLNTQSLRESFDQLKRIYPDAVFPDIYFVIGQLTSGGTVSNSGLLIGVEMSSVSPDTPLASLNEWEKANIAQSDHIPSLIAHELIHYQQKGTGDTSLLAQALVEGGADFVAGQIAKTPHNSAVEQYAAGHEAELWKRFAAEKDGTDTKFWLYGVPPVEGVPSDLGYWAERRICESYYSRARDRAAAMKEIIEMRHPREIYSGSEFGIVIRP
jgi:hypothetical protein